MKTLLLYPVVIYFSILITYAQLPNPGKYQSADGRYAISIAITPEGGIQLTEPNKVSVYKKDGNYYRHSDPNYAVYLIRVGSATEIYSLKEGSASEYKFSWVSAEELSVENCELYNKYLAKAEDADGNEVQAWTFCAAAALAKCNYTVEGFREMVVGVVAALKPIVFDKKCPCDDVIPIEIWNAN